MDRSTIYDRQAVKRRLAQLFAAYGRGAGSALARHVGVSPTSANRWAAPHGDCPAPSYWPAIEQFFKVEPGDLARAGGLHPPPAGPAASAVPEEELELAALIGELSPEGKAAAEAYIRFLRSNETR